MWLVKVTDRTVTNLTGNWTGMIGLPMTMAAVRFTWIASQTGTTVVGPATVLKPASNLPITGIVLGSLSGTRLALTYTVPRGAVDKLPDCTISGNGSATASTSSITGTFTLTVSSCDGSGILSVTNESFTLTRD